jgi:thiol-disulfide isomerase/thioredoxin
MAGFVEVITRAFRPYKRSILIISLLILFIIVAIYGFRHFYLKSKKNGDFKNVANANRRDPEIEIYLFWTDWCPHCKKAKPDWVAFQQEYNGQSINNFAIKCTDVDCSDDKDAKVKNLLSQYKVKSYPTIVALKNSEPVEFDAKISKSSLDQFVQSLTAK